MMKIMSQMKHFQKWYIVDNYLEQNINHERIGTKYKSWEKIQDPFRLCLSLASKSISQQIIW